jgi:hypothetical protein
LLEHFGFIRLFFGLFETLLFESLIVHSAGLKNENKKLCHSKKKLMSLFLRLNDCSQADMCSILPPEFTAMKLFFAQKATRNRNALNKAERSNAAVPNFQSSCEQTACDCTWTDFFLRKKSAYGFPCWQR